LLERGVAVAVQEGPADVRAAKDDEGPKAFAAVGDEAKSLLGDVSAKGDVEVL